MTEWRECKLKDVCKYERISINPQKYKILQFVHYSFPAFDNNKTPEIQFGGQIKSSKYIVKKGYILYNKLNVRFKRIWNINFETPENSICSSEFLPILATKCNQDYLYYFLCSDELTDTMANSNTGTSGSHQRIDPNFLMKYDILLPPLPEQKAIAEVLSSLDDKIDLLTRQNKTLEDLAQAYFRKWFIEDASSEWEVGKLGDEFNITMGQSPKGETYNDLKIGLPFFQGKAEFGFRFPLEKQYCSEPIKIADKFDTLLSVRAPVGALNMALYKCCIGRGLAIPIHKKGYKHYTFYKMKSLQELFNTFDDDGTVFGSISREKFLSIDNVIPPEKLVCYFDNFAKYFDLKIYENTVQIRTLSKLRDTLLPKLISGEVRVNI
jgi:type I restriction enzyme S subunit